MATIQDFIAHSIAPNIKCTDTISPETDGNQELFDQRVHFHAFHSSQDFYNLTRLAVFVGSCLVLLLLNFFLRKPTTNYYFA